MSWFRGHPPENGCVRNLVRFDHNFVELTHEGLVCSPSYFDRVADDGDTNRVNVFGYNDVESCVKVVPRFMEEEIFEAVFQTKSSRQKTKDKYHVTSFEGDPIFRPCAKPGDIFACSGLSPEPDLNKCSPERITNRCSSEYMVSRCESEIKKPTKYPPGFEIETRSTGRSKVRKSRGSTRSTHVTDKHVTETHVTETHVTDKHVIDSNRDHVYRNLPIPRDFDGSLSDASLSDDREYCSIPRYEKNTRDSSCGSSLDSCSSSENDNRATRTYAGVDTKGQYYAELYRKNQEEFGLSVKVCGNKVIVSKVMEGSLAQKQGIHVYDEIISINNNTISKHITISQGLQLIKYTKSLQLVLKMNHHRIIQVPPDSQFTPTGAGKQKTTIVQLKNSIDGLGLTLARNQLGVILVKDITNNKTADKDGRLQIGDQIIKIGGINIEGMNMSQVSKMLKNSGKFIQLDVVPKVPPKSNSVKQISLKKEENCGLGIGVEIHTSRSKKESEVFIRNILPSSPAWQHRDVDIGDQILTINRRQLKYLSSQEILALLKDPQTNIFHLTVKNLQRPTQKEISKRIFPDFSSMLNSTNCLSWL